MAVITSLGRPVALSGISRTILLDNFSGSYTLAGSTPQISAFNQSWTSGPAVVSGVAQTGLASWQSSTTIIPGAGDTFLKDAAIDVGYYTPISSPPDLGAEYRCFIRAGYSIPTNLSGGQGSVSYTAELCELIGTPTGASQLGGSFNPSGQLNHSTLSPMTSAGQWLLLTAQTGIDDGIFPVIQSFSFTQLPDTMALSGAYQLTLQITAFGMTLLINGTTYGTLAYALNSGWRDLYLSSTSFTVDRRSYPGSGGIVDIGGFHSIRVAPLNPLPLDPLWGEYTKTVELR